MRWEKNYRSTLADSIHGPFSKLDSWPLDPPGTGLFVSAAVTVLNSFGLAGSPQLQTPDVGAPTSGPDANVLVGYGLNLPLGSIHYRIDIRVAVPTTSDGTEELSWTKHRGRVIVFEDINYGGFYRFIDDAEADFTQQGGFWNDRISSCVVLSGQWRFYRDILFQQSFGGTSNLGPGMYNWLPDYGIEANSVSSLLCVG